MSYPRQITVVAVEDEFPMRDLYDQIFKVHEQQGRTAPLLMLGSLDEARKLLEGDTIVHLMLLDLGLPVPARGSADMGVQPGFAILELAAKRDAFPVPAVLVVSGRMNRANPPEMHAILRQFWYGEALSKGVSDEEKEIGRALDALDRYTGVGIHIRDGGKPSPTLAPREEDLLRRCALDNNTVGVDLRWWGDYQSRTSTGSGGEARVLAGEFLLDRGMGRSRQTFFKFESAENAAWVHRDAGIMNHKLQHVKVVCSMASRSRALLATQTVAASAGELLSLQEFLERPADEVVPMLPGVIADVHQQLEQLGTTSESQRRISDLLWRHHDRTRIREVWARFGGAKIAPELDPAALLDELNGDPSLVWVCERPCTHGDLNPTNVAVEVSDSSTRAYIFDAGGVQRDVAFRDLAYLEVTSLLHHRSRRPRSIVNGCASLYGGELRSEYANGLDESTCTRHLVENIRNVARVCDSRLYSLLVLDAALLQFGGLAFGEEENKVAIPAEAIQLVQLAAAWYRRGG